MALCDFTFLILLVDESDLNLTINKEDFVNAVPLYEQNFVYMWAGAKSTYGFNSGKIYYDVKVKYFFKNIYIFY